jgi:hypothetical protein
VLGASGGGDLAETATDVLSRERSPVSGQQSYCVTGQLRRQDAADGGRVFGVVVPYRTLRVLARSPHEVTDQDIGARA